MNNYDDDCQGDRDGYRTALRGMREEVDGIDYVSEDLRDLRMAALLGLDWTPEQDAADDAAAEQIAAAIAEAERFDSRRHYPELHRADETIRRATGNVIAAHRSLGSSALWEHVVDPAGARGEARPFDSDAAESYVGALLGLRAGQPHKLHILRGSYSPEVWLERIGAGRCDWTAHAGRAWNAECFSYSTDVLAFASGQFLVAFRTCQACHAWLAAGAPSPARQR